MSVRDLENDVINAAIEANRIGTIPSTAQLTVLRQAVHKLIFTCDECNYDRHLCPGCGTPVPHAGKGVCRECEQL